MNNALLGTATGIIIMGIIGVLIFFVHKKSRANSNTNNEQYTVSDTICYSFAFWNFFIEPSVINRFQNVLFLRNPGDEKNFPSQAAFFNSPP